MTISNVERVRSPTAIQKEVTLLQFGPTVYFEANVRIPRIYTAQPLTQGLRLELEEGPSRYLARVLRMQPGRELVLFNGTGGEFEAAIDDVGKRPVTVQVGELNALNSASPMRLGLACGPF